MNTTPPNTTSDAPPVEGWTASELEAAARALHMDDGNPPESFNDLSSPTRMDKLDRALVILQAATGALSLEDLAKRRGFRRAGGAQ